VRRSGTPGRLSQELEDAIALRPAAGFDLVPENGVGAQIIMPLVWPSAKQPHLPLVASAEEDVRADFARFLTVAEWATTEGENLGEIVGAVPERDARTRMALEALRLLPRADGNIEAVEIGGRAVQRPRPVRLRPETHARLLSVVQEGRHPSDFEREGVMRAADLDQGRFRLKFDDRSSRVVFLQDAELTERAAAVLGRTVRVIGQEYSRPARAPFVVASSIEPVETDDLDDDDRA
jgi:hypothetical protein